MEEELISEAKEMQTTSKEERDTLNRRKRKQPMIMYANKTTARKTQKEQHNSTPQGNNIKVDSSYISETTNDSSHTTRFGFVTPTLYTEYTPTISHPSHENPFRSSHSEMILDSSRITPETSPTLKPFTLTQETHKTVTTIALNLNYPSTED